MEQRRLGRSGVRVGALALGAMMFGPGGNTDADDCVAMIHRALDAGVNLVDTADGYGGGESERIVGRALAGRRDDVVLATKCYFPRGKDPNRRGGSRRWIVQACEASLRRLGVDHLDLYQLHRLDPDTDPEESLAAMSDLVRAGKVRMIGTSGATGSQLVECQWIAERARLRRPVCEQPPYSLLTRGIELDVLPTAVRHDLGVIVYGPLNGGWLTGKYRRDAEPPAGTRAAAGFFRRAWWDADRPEVASKFDLVDACAPLAAEAGLSLAHLALGFVLSNPAVSAAIIGPRTPAQLDDLLAASDVRLDADLLARLDAIVAPGIDIDPSNIVRVGPTGGPVALNAAASSGRPG